MDARNRQMILLTARVKNPTDRIHVQSMFLSQGETTTLTILVRVDGPSAVTQVRVTHDCSMGDNCLRPEATYFSIKKDRGYSMSTMGLFAVAGLGLALVAAAKFLPSAVQADNQLPSP